MAFPASTCQFNRNNIFLSIVLFAVFLYTIILFYGKTDDNLSASISTLIPSSLVDNTIPEEKSWHELAKESGTSKVIDVSYQCMYPEALAPFRHKKELKILEIGLGCGMWYGPGASFKLWSSYFEDAQIYFLEYDKTCGENWYTGLLRTFKAFDTNKNKLPIMTYGDQTDTQLLKRMAMDHGPWDIIIDDGCHRSACQIASFTTLFGDVKPGGIYFIEDLYIWQIPKSKQTISMIAEVYAQSIDSIALKNETTLGSELDRLTCCSGMCALRRKSMPTT